MRGLLVLMLSLTVCGYVLAPARAQSTTRSADAATRAPTPPAALTWEQTVRTVAAAMVDSREQDALARVLPPGTAIRRFDRAEPEDRLSLRQVTAGAVVVSAAAYPSQPQTVATDLAKNLVEAGFLPESIRAEFSVEGSNTVRRANETAGQWVTGALQPGVEQLVGVIALWQERAPEAASQQPTGTLIFVLLKGDEISPRQYRVASVIYGDVTQIVR